MLTSMTTIKPVPEHVLVMDLESTGLDERDPNASLLEVGLLLCERTAELPVLAEARLLIRPPGTLGNHDVLWAGLPPEVREMHDASGLWREATMSKDGWAVSDADSALAGWLREHTHSATSLVQPAGSGVAQFDLRWAREFLPRLSQRFHYRPLDASSLREGFLLAGRPDLVDFAKHVDAKPHRALEDARLHRLELVAYMAALSNCGGAAPVEEAAPPAVQETCEV